VTARAYDSMFYSLTLWALQVVFMIMIMIIVILVSITLFGRLFHSLTDLTVK